MTISRSDPDIYGGQDPRDIPAYGFNEAARYLKIAPATLRSWVIGRPYPLRERTGFFEPLIQLPDSNENKLSFANLVEAHVLRSLRTEHSVSIQAVRRALQYAQNQFNIKRLLLSPELLAGAGELFLNKYSELISLSKSGQFVLRKVLESYLKRIEWENDLPIRLYPFLREETADDARPIVINPFISFGRPIIERKSVSTATIVDRFDAGETESELAADYDLEISEIETAIIYELAA